MLQNGQVLIAGGKADLIPSGAYNSAEIYYPIARTFMVLFAALTTAREGHSATLLNSGQVLLTGGDLPGTGSLNSAEIYDPVAGTFTAISGTLAAARACHSATLMNGGNYVSETDGNIRLFV